MLPSPLPPVLAGPILRRVDWDSVSVWVALSKAAQVELTLYKGTPADTAPLGPHFVAGTAPLHSVTAATRKIGAKLHIALVTASLSGNAVLDPNEVYSYQIRLDGNDDLKSLGLLEDNDDDPAHPRLALGYDQGALPSFVSPPMEVADLVLLHGSCRKPHGAADEAMAYIDRIIADTRGTPRRPHQLFLTGDQIYADDVPSALLRELTEAGAELLGVTEQVRVVGNPMHDVTATNFPPGRRQKLITETALMSSTDAGSHLISFGEFCAAHLFAWSNAVWPDALKGKDNVLDDDAPASAIDNLLSSFGSKAFERAEDEFDDEIDALREYRDRLPEVRRALANVPVLMIFDDHEITDDWNLTKEWWGRIITSTNVLGRSIQLNGMAAYVLFQGWGNDPAYYAQSPGSDLLTDISGFFTTNPGPKTSAISAFAAKIEASPPVLRWHYIVERPKYRFIVLDTRTRRSYATEIGSPALLSSDALDEQIPPWLPPLDATIIVSAAPVLGLPVLEKAFPVLARLLYAYRVFEHPLPALWKHEENKEEGLLKYDMEAWSFDTPAFESLLARLYDLNRVVLLGGDVHYAFSTAMTYWRNAVNPRRFAQLTASPLKNTAPFAIDVLKSTLGALVFDNTDRSEAMLGWKPPVTVTDPPPWNDFNLKARLEDSPVMLPEGADVALDRTSDWSWRVELQRDTRPDDGSPGSRPPVTAWPQLNLDVDLSPQSSHTFYVTGLSVHGRHLLNRTPRAVVWHSSLGQITFEKTGAQDVFVRHSLIYVTSAGVQPDEPQPWVHHRIQIGPVADNDVPALQH